MKDILLNPNISFMKNSTLKSGFLLLFIAVSLSINAYTITTPTISINPTEVSLSQSNTWTFDFSSSTLIGSENLVIYFWQPTTHASVPLTKLGDKKWSLTFTPTTFFGMTASQIASNIYQFYYNIQDGVGGVTGTLHTTFTTPVSTTTPVSISNNPSGTYPLDQPVTWTFDLTGSGFTVGQDLYMWAWSPSNPDTGNYNNSSAFAKLSYVNGMIWSITLTPTLYFNKTVSEILTAGFWMKLKDKTGKIETGTFNVPFSDAPVLTTSIEISGNNINSAGATSQLSVIYTPSNATPRVITWSIDDSSIATISTLGLLTPKKNGIATVTASLTQNSQNISATKQITISNQITELYLTGTATQGGTNIIDALAFSQVMGITTDYVNGLFEIPTTLNATGTLRFVSSRTNQNPLIYGMGATTGTIVQNGTDITPTVSGEVLIRVNLATGTYKIYPINPLRISQMGSSVSYGWGATNNQGYAYRYNQLLSQRFSSNIGANWAISNISIGGNATPDLLNRWETDLLNDNSKYVVYALSLGNEGIMGGGQNKFDQFKNNMQLLIAKARAAGKIPIVANCYANGGYTATEYNFVKQMNLLINEWDVPSYNFLGADDDETGKWVTGYVMDAAHPNTEGHIEFFHSIVPSLFDALAAGKPQPTKQNGNSWLRTGSSITSDKFSIIPENILHSFTNVIDIRTNSTGVISSFTSNSTQGLLRIEPNGTLSYISPGGTTINGTTIVNDGQWHKISLTHYYALGKTNLYVDNTYHGSINEKLIPTSFTINPDEVPSAIDYRDWMLYRSGMNNTEIEALNTGKMLKSSLEIYAPLDEQDNISTDTLVNLAQSTNKVQRVKLNTAVTKLSHTSDIKIYPNPVADKLNINGIKSDTVYDFTIYGLDGIIVSKPDFKNNNLTISELPSNSYILLIKDKSNSEQISLRFQKIKHSNN